MRFLVATIFALTLFVRSAVAAISVLTLGGHNQVAATTNVLTTVTNDCPVGSLIVIEAGYTTIADTVSSVVDSGGNTWQTPFDNITGTGIGIGWAYATNSTVDLPVGGTITVTFAGSVTSEVTAVCVQGIAKSAPLDISNKTAQGVAQTSATTVNSGTLSQANEILLGGLVTATASGVNSCGGSFTKPFSISSTPSIIICSLIVASTSSVGFTPTWTNSVNYVSDLVSFKAPSGTPLKGLLGIGQ